MPEKKTIKEKIQDFMPNISDTLSEKFDALMAKLDEILDELKKRNGQQP
jgi:hypothetical protein